MALDWLIRVNLPAFLYLLPALQPHAATIRALPEIIDPASAQCAGLKVISARAAASAAAWNAAWNAASAAASVAADGTLAPVVSQLQHSAQDLVRQMAAVSSGG